MLIVAGTSSRPFSHFTKENFEMLMRLKWRWVACNMSPNKLPAFEEAKSVGETPPLNNNVI